MFVNIYICILAYFKIFSVFLGKNLVFEKIVKKISTLLQIIELVWNLPR
jgi:hypothetical protein